MGAAQEDNVYRVASRMVRNLEQQSREGNDDTALLAALRNSAGKSFSAAEEVWPYFFENLPQSFLGRTGVPTAEETAIFSALQIYAICRQGTAGNVTADETFRGTMGLSLGKGRTPDNAKSLDRRFNAMITAADVEEFLYHLRQMVKLVKSNTTTAINYAKLANDIYWYQKGDKERVCFRWATDYYSSGNNSAADKQEEDHE